MSIFITLSQSATVFYKNLYNQGLNEKKPKLFKLNKI